MDLKFQEGVKLWNEGKSQEGANVWMDLAELGHLDSIEELVYVFFDQKDYLEAETYINYAKDQSDPIILYLRARLIEESVGFEESIDSFKFAIDAGSPDACRKMFFSSIFNEWLDDAIYYLDKLKEYPDYFNDPRVTYSMEDLEQELNDLRSNLEAVHEAESDDRNNDADSASGDSDELGDLELDGCQRDEWLEVIKAFVSDDEDVIQEIEENYPRTFEAFVNLRDYGLFEIWAEWGSNLEFGRGREETQSDFLAGLDREEEIEDENGVSYISGADLPDWESWQRLSVQEEYLPSSDDDRYVFNIEGGVCAISGKAPRLSVSEDQVESESQLLVDTSGIECRLHKTSDECYNKKCEASLITISSGLGDGLYRIAAFDNSLGDVECVLTYFLHPFAWDYVESKLILGEGTMDTKDDGTLVGNLEDHIPIYLGEIKSDGSLNFGDRWAWSEAGRGDDYKIASIAVPADEYLVLGWIHALSFEPDAVRVFIVGLYRGEMKQYYLNLMDEFPVMKTFADEHLDFARNLGDY